MNSKLYIFVDTSRSFLFFCIGDGNEIRWDVFFCFLCWSVDFGFLGERFVSPILSIATLEHLLRMRCAFASAVIALLGVAAAEYADVIALQNSANFLVEDEQAKCQTDEHGLGHEYCSNVEYLYGVHDMKQSLSVKPTKKLPKMDTIEQSEEPFSTLFESYIITNR